MQISQATAVDLPECARLIAVAFEEDPVVCELVPGDENRIERLTRFFVSELRSGSLRTGAVDIVRLEQGGPIVGAAAWVGPEKGPWWSQLREIPNLIRAIGLRHLRNAVGAMKDFSASHPDFVHWYLSDIVVSPLAQGQGVGGKLLTYRLDLVDAEGLPAYLEATTEGSRRLYARYGFEDVGQVRIGGVTASAMTRPARR